MDRKELESQVISCVAIAYNKDASELTVDTSFKTDLKGASTQMVALVATLENEMDVTLMLADAAACGTIADLCDLVADEL